MGDLQDTIQFASQGDRNALEALLERYLPQVRAFARLHMGPLAQQESSSDIVQSVCRQVIQNLDAFDYRGEAAFRKWLLTACTNRLRDHKKYWLRDRRDVRRDQELRDSAVHHVQELLTPSGELIKREELGRLEAALDRLPEDYREVISLSRLLGMPHVEIAKHLGKSEGATRILLHRAIARLGLELAGDDE